MSMRALFSRSAFAIAAVLAIFATHAVAHHGWGWTSDDPFELTGVIDDIYLGQPHPTLTVTADDGVWEIELAPLSRTTAAGFVEGAAAPGDEVTAYGYRSLDADELRMKAARIVVRGETYDVYPRQAEEF